MDQQNSGTGGAGLMNKVKEGAVSQLNTQKDRATSGIGSVANVVRQTTQPLRDAQQETMAHYVEQAAGQLDRFSTALKEKDVSELLDDAQRFARRNPAIFIGSAFALGLVAARFFKSSNDRNSQSGDWRRNEYGMGDRRDRSLGSMSTGYSTGAGVTPVGTAGRGTTAASAGSADPGTTSTPRGHWGHDSGKS
ncbi:MAG: hypothetical protein ABIQ52_19715 [Vicinamibacterales bacterium]